MALGRALRDTPDESFDRLAHPLQSRRRDTFGDRNHAYRPRLAVQSCRSRPADAHAASTSSGGLKGETKMKLNFWQWLGIIVIVLGAIGWYLYKTETGSRGVTT